MRILQLSNRIPWPLNEGGTIGIYNYTKAFHDLGHDVTLCCLSPHKHAVSQEELNRELGQFCNLITHQINTEVNWWDALKNLFSTRSYNVERFDSPTFRAILEKHLRENEYDIIQLEGTFVGPYIDSVKQYSNAVLVLRQHNVEYQIWERLARNTKNLVKRCYLKLLAGRLKKFEKTLFQKIDAIVPVTKEDLKLFNSMGNDLPAFVSPAGIDTRHWQFNPSLDPNRMYHIGSMEWMPNREAVDWFTSDIWPNLKKHYPELEFHVAGKKMPEFYKTLNGNGLYFHGEVDDAYEFIYDKGVCIVPLKSGSGIRLKILEAMSAGRIVISTTVGAQGISYTKNKDLFIADSLDEFKTIIHTLKNDPNKGVEVAHEGRKTIEKYYSNEAVVNNLIGFYSDLMQKQ